AEDVQWSLSKPLAARENPEDGQHPSSDADLLRPSCRRVWPCKYWRRKQDLEGFSVLELLIQSRQKTTVGIEPGDFILILVGHQPIGGAGDGPGESLAAFDGRRRLKNPSRQSQVSVGVTSVPVGGEVLAARLDECGQGRWSLWSRGRLPGDCATGV